MTPVCLKPLCPKILPMTLLKAESSLTHKQYYCPHDGSMRSEVTPIGMVGSLAPPVLFAGGLLTIVTTVISMLHGDVSGAHELMDLPEVD